MKRVTRSRFMLFILAALATGSLYADNTSSATGSGGNSASLWQGYSDDMSDREYRNTYRANQRHIGKFISNYSENTLLSLGVPKGGVNLLGAAAGLAIKQDATIYLNKSHFLVLGVKDVAGDSRAVTFGFKFDW